jgi:photosystem II stability/assembly factor-like uncharacterized protein
MTAELVLSVLQGSDDARGYVASFAVTDQMIVALGGTSNRSPTVLASSDARHFEPRATPQNLGLRDILAVGDSLWACGEHGQLAVSRDHGGHWQLLETGTEGCLFGLTLGSDGAIWVVGDAGYAARVLGEKPRQIEVGTRARLSSVRAVRDEIVMLGDDGMVLRWRDGKAASVACGATRPLTALAITSKGTWVVIGDGGFVARSPDGTWYSRVDIGVDVDLEAIGVLPDGTLVIVGDRGRLLLSTDDARSWRSVANDLGLVHLWSIVRFGGGVLIGGDDGLIVKLAPPGDATWSDRMNVFGGAKVLDGMFAAGPDGFIANGLAAYLAAIAAGNDEDNAGEDAAGEDADGDAGEDEDDADGDGGDDDGVEVDQEAFALLGKAGGADDFRAIYGVALPIEARWFFELVAGRDRWSSFTELRLDHALRPDVGAHNLFELMVRRNQQAYLGTDLVEAFCGVFGIGSQGNGDTYHLEVHEWDGRRQVLHFDHETAAFSGVFADSLDSLVYLAALVKVGDDHVISDEAYAGGLRHLRGKVAPTWHFSIDEKDAEFVELEPRRRDTELFYYRSRWICALLKNDGITDRDEVPSLFDPELNQVIAADQLPARFEACEKFIPTALYTMWRAYLFDEPELARYLEIGRQHVARLVRDAATLIDELRDGRNELGTIKDVRAWLTAFRALDLDPRRADQRKAEADHRARADEARRVERDAELERTPPARWGDLAWQWLDDGVAHRALLVRLDRTQGAQIAAIDELRDASDDERAIALPRLAAELSPELEAVLVGSLVRGDRLEDVLVKPRETNGDDDAVPDEDDPGGGEANGDGDDDDDDRDDDAPDRARIAAALAMTHRGLGLAPDDGDLQFTHAMLLMDAERAGDPAKANELLASLQAYAPPVRINIAVRMGKAGHARFGEAVELVLGEALPARILGGGTSSAGGAGAIASFGDVAHELFGELGEALLAHAPQHLDKLIPRLPDDAKLLSELAHQAIAAHQRDAALALYDRLVALPIPDDGDERTVYLRALNNACVQAHAAQAFEAAVRIADRAQPAAHDNPHLYHAAACAYAAVHDYAKAFEQVKLAVAHDYEHAAKLETDADLGPLLEWPELQALFRDWHARREGN